MRSFDKFKSEFKCFRGCRSGNVALFTALGLMALTFSAGAAIDYSTASSYWTSATAAADGAALAAAAASGNALKRGNSNWQSVGIDAGNRFLQKNMRSLAGASANNVKFNLENTGKSVDVTLKFDAAYNTAFMQLAGIKTLTHPVVAAAQGGLPNYVAVHFLIDNSSSMGIGATANDQLIMQNAVGCTIACHIGQQGGLLGNYDAVRATNATLRIDVVRQAVKKFLQDMMAAGYQGSQVSVSIDLMGNELQPLVAPTTDLKSVLDQVDQIELNQLTRGTNISYSMQQLAGKLGTSGNGSSPDNRLSFVVFATDGIENGTAGHLISPGLLSYFMRDPNLVYTSPREEFTYEITQTIEGNACDPVKALGHKVLVAHVQYLIPVVGWDSRFDFIKNQLLDKSNTSLISCASSPNYAFMAHDSADIQPAFDNIRQAIEVSTNLRLTR